MADSTLRNFSSTSSAGSNVGSESTSRSGKSLCCSLGSRREAAARAIELCGAEGLAKPRPKTHRELAGTQRDKLLAAWREYQELRARVPLPSIHHPHQWRAYKQTLVRYDELIRAGSIEQAAELALGLDQRAQELKRQDSVALSSAPCTLTMNTIQGEPGSESETLRQPL